MKPCSSTSPDKRVPGKHNGRGGNHHATMTVPRAPTLLIVEDNADDFGLLKACIRSTGIIRQEFDRFGEKTIRWAKTLSDGIQLTRHHPPDIVLLDLALPDSVGINTIEHMHAALPNAVIVVLTGNDDMSLATTALQAGAQDYLVKGQYDQETLARAIHHALARQAGKQALVASETRYHALFANSRVVMLLVDPATRNIVDANEQASHYYGYTLNSLKTMNIEALFAPQKGSSQVTLALTRDPAKSWIGVRHQLSDGRIRDVEMSTGAIEIDGRALLLSIIIDVTERKQAEQQLRIAAAAFESQEGILVTDANRVILKVNRAFTEITGYTATDAIGNTAGMLKSDRHDAGFYKNIAEALRSKGTWQGEIWNRRKNGEVFPVWLTITAVTDAHGKVTHYVTTMTDITARKKTDEKINHLAFYDALTGLPNRRLLIDRLQHCIAAIERNERRGALLFIDLDNFKALNDTQGHDVGDMLLKQVASRLSTCIRDGDTVARFGGDEFVVMLQDLNNISAEAAAQTLAVSEKILHTLNKPYMLGNMEYFNTPSIGATVFGDHLLSVDEVLKRADIAMYQAKSAGRNTLRFFDPEMQAIISVRSKMESDLREALRLGQFTLNYQAQIDIENQLVGAEALVRWQHPQHGEIRPEEFIPLAEETGLILPLGQWVLETVCAQLAAWATDQRTADLTISVNISGREFRQPDIVARILNILHRTGAAAKNLKLELTETLLLEDIENAIDKMNTLKEHGVGFSLDDFGTGYSSLFYLKRLPIDELKIDMSFVRDVLDDPDDAAIACTIIALGQILGLTVIAEGVETVDQRDFLAEQGCYIYQGYLFDKPGDITSVLEIPHKTKIRKTSPSGQTTRYG